MGQVVDLRSGRKAAPIAVNGKVLPLFGVPIGNPALESMTLPHFVDSSALEIRCF